ncbi:ParA/MinD ATPase-like protein [Halovivax asiaticus JCM 14624]|uniref:Iron-sulfur cluster carrier protein n=1 Tax=Halovivax asiaticus JCM 14624 TaxID=1227490 RepID=M0BS39_9EURY|nr:Mrp/NBP35 family ATP-binding protein [Halovivax asiaticus]ELZ13760.1 ParA/MinD ATPase-like protein [Halovivax asiaticus JCM 14624]
MSSPTTEDVYDALATVEDPTLGDDVVSLGLINDIEIDDETVTVSLALNTPYDEAEAQVGTAIRDAIEELGAEPDIRARVGADIGFDAEVLPRVKNVIAVSSGKGGVGKTTVAANLAAGLEKRGAMVGLLDADIHGPNVPRILPVESEPGVTPDDELVPPRSDGVRVISTGFLLENDDDPAMLRGPMVNKFMMKFFEGVEWGRLDYLVVDLPPGTGDATLNLLQAMPVTGTVIVTTPQDMALDDTRKGIEMYNEHDTPVIGVVENMSSFVCPSCGDEHRLLGDRQGVEQTLSDYEIPLVGSFPMHPDFGKTDGHGPIVKNDDSEVQSRVDETVESILGRIGEINRQRVADHRGEGENADEDADSSPVKSEYDVFD